MQSKSFTGEIYAGHTTDCGVIVPFDVARQWPGAKALPIGYRKLVGHALKGKVNGVAFESWAFFYFRQWRLVVPGPAMKAAGVAAGDSARFTLRPHAKPETVAKFVPGPKRAASGRRTR